jgi:hypothetical protein
LGGRGFKPVDYITFARVRRAGPPAVLSIIREDEVCQRLMTSVKVSTTERGKRLKSDGIPAHSGLFPARRCKFPARLNKFPVRRKQVPCSNFQGIILQQTDFAAFWRVVFR